MSQNTQSLNNYLGRISRSHALIHGSILRVLAQAIQIVITLFLTPVIVTSLGDRDYGLWSLIGSFFFYFGLMDFGLSSAIARFLSRALAQDRLKEEKEYIDTGFIIYASFSLVTVVIGFITMALGPAIIKQNEILPLFRILIAIATLSVAANLPFRVFLGILKARLRYDYITLITLVLSLLKSALIYSLLIRGYGIVAMGAITLTLMLLESIAYYFYASRMSLFTWRAMNFKRLRCHELITYSAYAFIAGVAELLMTRIDTLVITMYRGLELVTPYSLALSIIRYGQDFTISVLGTLDPVFSQDEGRGDFQNIRRVLLFTSKISAVVCTITFACIATYGHHFIQRWIGKDYDAMHTVILWLSLAMLAPTAQRPAISLIYGISKHRAYACMTLIEGCANLFLSITLIHSYGIIGVAIASGITSVIMKFFILPIFVSKVAEIPINQFLGAFLLRGLALSIAFNFLFYYIVVQHYLAPEYTRIILLAIAHTLIFAPFALFVVFSRIERRYLFQRIATLRRKKV